MELDHRSLGELAGILILAMGCIVLSVVALVFIVDRASRPMPCDEAYVYVWEEYPDDAKCVKQDDHEGHMNG